MALDMSVPDLRRQLDALLADTIDLNQFERWLIMSEIDIEQCGSEQDVDLLDAVMLLHAELTGDHISASHFVAALRELGATEAVETELAPAAIR
jgi:hypothetical protein